MKENPFDDAPPLHFIDAEPEVSAKFVAVESQEYLKLLIYKECVHRLSRGFTVCIEDMVDLDEIEKEIRDKYEK